MILLSRDDMRGTWGHFDVLKYVGSYNQALSLTGVKMICVRLEIKYRDIPQKMLMFVTRHPVANHTCT